MCTHVLFEGIGGGRCIGVICIILRIATIHGVINPRRACAARVTVVVLCVCVSVCVCVCLRLFSDYRLRGGL